MRSARCLLARTLTLASRYSVSISIAAWLLISAPGDAAGQPAEPPARAAAASDAVVPGSELTVYLMTMGPGDAVWEKFGHNAIWIHNSARNTDVAYNWGLFDFEASDFMSRFLKGDMRYWMGGFDQKATVDFYRQANRSVIAQELNLTPEQRTELARFVEWNALPENRFYRYNYYLDNCSTRIRDAIDRALGGTLKPQMESGLSDFTYRSETQRLTQSDIPVYTGTMLGLGRPVDHRLTGWQLAFIPGRLSEMLRDAEVPDGTGKFVNLVKSEDTLFAASRPPEPRAVELHAVNFFLAGCLLFAIIIGLARLANARRRWWQPGFLVVAALSSLIIGLAGTGLVALWLMTNHIHSFSNENVLQATPLNLVLAVMILTQFRMRRQGVGNAPFVRARIVRVAWVIVGLSALGLVLKILPGFNQDNLQIIGLLLPVHLGIALALAGGGLVPARFRRTPAAAAAT